MNIGDVKAHSLRCEPQVHEHALQLSLPPFEPFMGDIIPEVYTLGYERTPLQGLIDSEHLSAEGLHLRL